MSKSTAENLRLSLKEQRLSHDNTTESRQNRSNENGLANDLNAFVNLLKRNFLTKNILDVTQIRNVQVSSDTTLDKEFTYNVIYPRAQKGFELGVEYITRLIGKTPVLLPEDTRAIQSIAKFYNEKFWDRMREVIDRKYLNFQVEDQNISEISNNFVVTSLSTAIVWKSLYIGTVMKGQNMIKKDDMNFGIDFPVFHAAIKQIEKDLVRRNPGIFLTGNQEDARVIILVWKWVTSQDAKVCPICTDLSKQEWDHDETFLPINPDDSHYNCRCRLMLEESRRQIV
jgi:hypothetical protein